MRVVVWTGKMDTYRYLRRNSNQQAQAREVLRGVLLFPSQTPKSLFFSFPSALLAFPTPISAGVRLIVTLCISRANYILLGVPFYDCWHSPNRRTQDRRRTSADSFSVFFRISVRNFTPQIASRRVEGLFCRQVARSFYPRHQHHRTKRGANHSSSNGTL